MISQDLQFEIKNENGKNINCIIVASVPVNENEINIMYKREDDETEVFRYGKILKSNDSYEIKKDISEEEILILKETFDNEIINMANEITQELEAQ